VQLTYQHALPDLEVVLSQRSQPSFFHANNWLGAQNIQYGTARMDLSLRASKSLLWHRKVFHTFALFTEMLGPLAAE
jgi:hypothetical protein